MDLLLAKVFPEEGKAMHFDRMSTWTIVVFILPMRQNSFLEESSLVTVPHPLHSLDLAPSDFWSFNHIKSSLAGRVFNDVDSALDPAIESVNEIQSYDLQLFPLLDRISEMACGQ
jgi:hypothetical protein